jgi:PhzF family phenazine biosynthesis protein
MKYWTVDSFTSTRFYGNPAGVVLLTENVDDVLMQRMAAEHNLSETAFVLQKSPGNWEIQFFTPRVEVRLCGHATLAAGHIIFGEQLDNSKQISFLSKAGILMVERGMQTAQYRMQLPSDRRVKPYAGPTAPLLKALGVPSQEVLRGTDDVIVITENEKNIRGARPDFFSLGEILARGIILTSRGDNPEVDFVCRCFYPACGINEDPVTGSAFATLAPLWGERLGRAALRGVQCSERGGTVTCEIDDTSTVLIGSAVTYLKGTIL